jgi:hypothetical protein
MEPTTQPATHPASLPQCPLTRKVGVADDAAGHSLQHARAGAAPVCVATARQLRHGAALQAPDAAPQGHLTRRWRGRSDVTR